MNNIDILEEKENIKLEDKYKQTLKMAKEVMEDVCERNNGCEPSKSECLAYNMQYVKKYVETLIAENKELKEENKELDYMTVYLTGRYDERDKWKSKLKEEIKAKIEEINKEMLNEENSLELFYRKKYCKEILQSLLEKE